ncbi:hypothetical protein G5B47_11610 [Paenibacillus sp. 7124]|uniref:Uncharacterized protein n=1 Tax=Paenibacillus apii TaxID=1850370 RepID=A0A6M1PS15_9BACL|nr:hypothetical protein [Paenibacillus apii]NGM83061.1 hypothetical protein [Paenibacillus apii]NJJ40202.1 hypothetical protein [Paenibacillus apii]
MRNLDTELLPSKPVISSTCPLPAFVTDSETGVPVGAFRRNGLKSILKDEWIILGPDEGKQGTAG